MLQLRLPLSPHPLLALPSGMTVERQTGGKGKHDKVQEIQVEAALSSPSGDTRMCLTVSAMTQGNMCEVGSILSVQHFYWGQSGGMQHPLKWPQLIRLQSPEQNQCLPQTTLFAQTVIRLVPVASTLTHTKILTRWNIPRSHLPGPSQELGQKRENFFF